MYKQSKSYSVRQHQFKLHKPSNQNFKVKNKNDNMTNTNQRSQSSNDKDLCRYFRLKRNPQSLTEKHQNRNLAMKKNNQLKTNRNTGDQQQKLKRSKTEADRYRQTCQSKSLFLTQHDQALKTKILWRPQPKTPVQHSPTSSLYSQSTKLLKIDSKKDLERLKNRYRKQVLKSKSKQQIFEQNMKMIRKIEDTPPQIQNWNYIRKLKKSPRARERQQYNQILFAKNMDMIMKIQDTPPKVDAWNYYRKKKSSRSRQRQELNQKLFSENMQIIDRIQNTPPKVDAWCFKKPKKYSKQARQRQRKNQLIFEQNMKIIQKIEDTPPKIQPWLYNKKSLQMKVKNNKRKSRSLDGQMLERMKLFIIEQQKRFQEEQLKKTSNTLQKIPQQKKGISNKRYKTVPNNFSPQKLGLPTKSPKAWKFVNNKYTNFTNLLVKQGSNGQHSPTKKIKVQQIKMKAKAKQSQAHFSHVFRMAKIQKN